MRLRTLFVSGLRRSYSSIDPVNSTIEAESRIKLPSLSSTALIDMSPTEGQMAEVQELVMNTEASTSNVESESILVQQTASHGAQLDSSLTSASAHPALKWFHASEEQYPWIKNGTVRSSNTPLLKFVHLTIPEDPSSLIHHLGNLHGPKFDLTTWARALLFRVLEDGFTTTLQKISAVKDGWLRKGHGHTRPSPAREVFDAVRASLSISCTLRLEDHQIIRSLWCITCTHRAASNLAAIAEIPVPIHVSEWIQDEQDPPYPEIIALRSLSGVHALYASLFRLQFYLKTSLATATTTTDTSENDFPRVQLGGKDKASQQAWSLISALEELENSSKFLLDQDSVLTEAPREPLSKAIADVLSTSRRSDNPDAFLIHVVDSEVDSSGQRPSKWCLMVLKDDADFNDGRELAALLRDAAKEVDGIALEHKIDEYESLTATMDWYFPTPEDMRFIEDWGASLASN